MWYKWIGEFFKQTWGLGSMWDVVAIISFLAVLGFIVLGIISLIKKKGRAKRNFLIAGLAFVLFMVGVVNSPSSETASTDLEKGETSAEEIKDGQEQSKVY